MNIKKTTASLIINLFIALFIYTAINKIITQESFERTISKIPLIGMFSYTISWMIPVIEFIIAVTLILPVIKKAGLYASLLLMFIFTIFLVYMVLSGNELPCSCGGIISSLTWNQHILFNIGFIILAITGLKLYKR